MLGSEVGGKAVVLCWRCDEVLAWKLKLDHIAPNDVTKTLHNGSDID